MGEAIRTMSSSSGVIAALGSHRLQQLAREARELSQRIYEPRGLWGRFDIRDGFHEDAAELGERITDELRKLEGLRRRHWWQRWRPRNG
jgi:hypothetical protein